MRILSWVLAIIGGICGVIGIAGGVIGPTYFIGTEAMGSMWWLLLSAIFLLATIATNQFYKPEV